MNYWETDSGPGKEEEVSNFPFPLKSKKRTSLSFRFNISRFPFLLTFHDYSLFLEKVSFIFPGSAQLPDEVCTLKYVTIGGQLASNPGL